MPLPRTQGPTGLKSRATAGSSLPMPAVRDSKLAVDTSMSTSASTSCRSSRTYLIVASFCSSKMSRRTPPIRFKP